MFPVSDVIPSRTRPYVTVGLIAANILAFLYQLQLDRAELYGLTRSVGVFAGEVTPLRLVASLFLHDGWIHAAANMLCLWIFGDNVEDALGRVWYLLFYLSTGAIAALAHAAIHPGSFAPLIGASGAVAGVMGAYFVLFPRSQILTAVFLIGYRDLIEVPAAFYLGLWLLLQLASNLTSMGVATADVGIAFGSHLAGFGCGALVGLAIRRKPREWD